MKRKATIQISVLMILVIIIFAINQHNILNMNLKNQKIEFMTKVNQAMLVSLKEIDYELFNKCILQYQDENISEELLNNFKSLTERQQEGITTSYNQELEEIDCFESLLLRFLVETKTTFDYQMLGTAFVDSVINVHFEQFGIDAPYELGLYCPLESRFLLLTSKDYEQQLLNEGTRYEVFSPSKEGVPNFDQMIVYFPELNSWLVRQNTDFYLLILIVIIIIAFCIITTYMIIRRQREFNELKTNLVNNMTHELKTPISTIGLACEALQDPSFEKNDELINTYIRIIKEENEKNKELIEHVLNIVRNDKQLRTHAEDIHVNKALEAIASMYQLAALKKNAHIILQLNAKDDLVFVDKVHISNALSNIVDNALKYSPHNPEIVINTRNNNKGEIVISIKDNGIGIRKSEQKKIFDEFYRIDTGNIHNVKGHGLGLHYVKQVIDFHHGRITVESKLNEGANFIISLPLKNINTN